MSMKKTNNNHRCRKAIGEIVVKHRNLMKLNQRELGVLAFNHNNTNDQQVISKLELGIRDLTTPELIELAKVFKISPAQFLISIIDKSK
jgi:hypothetical protein